MFKYVIWAIVIYCLVRFIFNFLIPIMRAARQMKSQVKDFQERMGGQQQQGNVNSQGFQGHSGHQSAQPKRPTPGPKSEDYIDFEEIK